MSIWYKQLEAGSFQLPQVDAKNNTLEIDQTQLSLLLAGIDLASVKQRKRYRAA